MASATASASDRPRPRRRRGLSIRYLLLASNAFVLLIAVFAVVFFRLWDSHLVRVTEERLMAESALIGEAWRTRLLSASGRPEAAGPLHLDRRDAAALPEEPALDLGTGVESPAPPPQRSIQPGETPEWRAGAAIEPLLRRGAQLNRSAAYVLDRHGCALASTREPRGACFDHLAEVRSALAGTYASAVRESVGSALPWPLSRAVSTGELLVSIATPVLEGGAPIGVVHMIHPSDSPLAAVWKHRDTVAVVLVGSLLLMAGVSLFLSRAISRPMRAITAAAEAVARGEPPQPFAPSGVVPKEVDTLSAALDRMTAQLTDRADYISAFAANVSHELKTPITGIRGAVELLRDAWAEMSDEQRQRFLENIDADATRMQRLVTRLLELARIQASPEDAEPVAIRPFLQRLAERYGGQVAVETNGAPATMLINPDHLEMALQNLLDNAVRHGAGQPVTVTVHGDNGRVAISIRDRGPGISPGNRARIFERFFTTERDTGGTGLGLAIARAVAETRGGTLTFETGDEGTTFTLVV